MITRVTADGGVRGSNPSPYGGQWAYRLSGADGTARATASGIVRLADVAPLPQVTNNVTEVLAILFGLEAVPDGWSGVVRTDSLIATGVFRDPARVWGWLPETVRDRVRRVVTRRGELKFELVAGHPPAKTLKLMRAGHTCYKPGKPWPYCLDNVWCDLACGLAWDHYEKTGDVRDDWQGADYIEWVRSQRPAGERSDARPAGV